LCGEGTGAPFSALSNADEGVGDGGKALGVDVCRYCSMANESKRMEV
jgi:hypothetical protein